MKFTLDSASGVNLVRSYARGELIIGERTVRASCIVSAESLIVDWPAESAAALVAADLEPIFELAPQIVLLGTGARLEFPSAKIRSAFATRGIGLEVMDLGAACRTFNVLVQEERRTVAALILAR